MENYTNLLTEGMQYETYIKKITLHYIYIVYRGTLGKKYCIQPYSRFNIYYGWH